MLTEFLDQLFAGRPVTLEVFRPIEAKDSAAAIERLAQFDDLCRLEAPDTPPPLDKEVALWAASQFLMACSFAVHREVAPDIVIEAMADTGPERSAATAHYAVDLTFRFLPDLIRLAASAAEDDPLVQALQSWAVAWPLSSVGISLPADMSLDEQAFEPILNNASLSQTYVDRVIGKNAVDRLSHPGVAAKVQASVGLHTHLAPEIVSLTAPHIQTTTVS